MVLNCWKKKYFELFDDCSVYMTLKHSNLGLSRAESVACRTGFCVRKYATGRTNETKAYAYYLTHEILEYYRMSRLYRVLLTFLIKFDPRRNSLMTKIHSWKIQRKRFAVMCKMKTHLW
ncbi:hypothetical protein Plhal304r1_c040g0117641 [Plasmopara halstedii]